MIPRLALLIVLVGAPAGADPLSVIPARYQAVSWFGSADAPLFAFWRTMPGGAPACVAKVLARSDGYVQAQLPKVTSSLIVFAGKLERAPTERCLREVLDKIAAPHARVVRDGALTEVATDTTAFYLGWASDGSVVEARDKAAVEEVLAHKSKPNPDVMAMVARVDRTKSMWAAGAIDYTTPLLGVASMGYFASIDPREAARTQHTPVTIVFPAAADAKQAAAAIAAAAHSQRFSTALQAQLGQVHATVTGADLVVDLAPLFMKPELMAEMTQAITAAAPR